MASHETVCILNCSDSDLSAHSAGLAASGFGFALNHGLRSGMRRDDFSQNPMSPSAQCRMVLSGSACWGPDHELCAESPP